MSKVEIVEVGPRDGLQNIPIFVPTETKVKLIRALAKAGFRRMEVGSFVSPAAIPQMRDMAQVAQEVGTLAGVQAMVLVPNSKGFERALAAGFGQIEVVISMSDAHNRSNVRRLTAESISDLRTMLTEFDPDNRLSIRVGLATSFHCPFNGEMSERDILNNLAEIVGIRKGMEYAISDTTGMALPRHVGSLCRRILAEFGNEGRFAFHGHDTAGFGIANVLSALEAGITTIDASVAGLGGCPFAPGATGNVASEDVVYLLAREGIQTGIDLDALLAAGDIATTLPGAVIASHARSIPRDRLFNSLAAKSADAVPAKT